MKKIALTLTVVSVAAILALAAEGSRSQRPEPVTLSGSVQKASGDAVASFKADDGKTYQLETMKAPDGRGRPDGNKEGNPPPKAADGKKSDGTPPQPPRQVKDEDIQAFIGKRATVTGFIPGKNRPDDAQKDVSKLPARDDVLIVTDIGAK